MALAAQSKRDVGHSLRRVSAGLKLALTSAAESSPDKDEGQAKSYSAMVLPTLARACHHARLLLLSHWRVRVSIHMHC